MGSVRDVVTAILGGGQGARLWPLTRDRAKPAVPVGGKFRLIDVPISNSLHAGIEQIYVLTQFNSASLHRHIAQTYRFDAFRDSWVDILAAEQGIENRDWYQGTADAIRQNLPRLLQARSRDILVLSGDHLYLMDLGAFVARHRDARADLTIAVTAVPRSQASGFGIMQVDGEGRIVRFVEKPKDEALLDELTPDREALAKVGLELPSGWLLASMGIYLFRSDVMKGLLAESTATDFGRDVIPTALESHAVVAFLHRGYWRDIGTIPSFHEANLDLTRPLPPLNLYSRHRPIYTHARFLPGTKINRCDVEQSILCEGSIITASRIRHSIVGIRAIVKEGTQIEKSVVMGARSYEQLDADAPSDVPLGIGRDCVVRNAIIDLDARIGDGVKLVNAKGVKDEDHGDWCIRDGIIVVARGATIPPGTEI
jgi:glucose-1-phosphate adenylyltransferase